MSTLIRTLLGHVAQRDGHITLLGKDASRFKPHEDLARDWRDPQERHRQRLVDMVQEARDMGAHVVEVNPAEEHFDVLSCKLAPTLDADEFIRRFLLHVIPSGLMRIRHYGFLANRHSEAKLACCRRLLYVTVSVATNPAKPFQPIQLTDKTIATAT